MATETILKKSERAPFPGVLVAEPQYRKYVANEFMLKDLKGEIAMLSNQVEGLQKMREEDNQNYPNVWNWFTTGLLLGAAGAFAAASK